MAKITDNTETNKADEQIIPDVIDFLYRIVKQYDIVLSKTDEKQYLHLIEVLNNRNKCPPQEIICRTEKTNTEDLIPINEKIEELVPYTEKNVCNIYALHHSISTLEEMPIESNQKKNCESRKDLTVNDFINEFDEEIGCSSKRSSFTRAERVGTLYMRRNDLRRKGTLSFMRRTIKVCAILRRSELYLFRQKSNSLCHNEAKIDILTSSIEPCDTNAHKFIIKVSNTMKYQFEAESEQQRNDWIKTLIETKHIKEIFISPDDTKYQLSSFKSNQSEELINGSCSTLQSQTNEYAIPTLPKKTRIISEIPLDNCNEYAIPKVMPIILNKTEVSTTNNLSVGKDLLPFVQTNKEIIRKENNHSAWIKNIQGESERTAAWAQNKLRNALLSIPRKIKTTSINSVAQRINESEKISFDHKRSYIEKLSFEEELRMKLSQIKTQKNELGE